MDILLYNPLSRNGKNERFIEKIKHQLKKQGNAVVAYNILTIEDPHAFISSCEKDDRVILVGGDGTINHLANRIYGLQYDQELYMYQAGTGNDFIRSLKTKDKIVPIKSYIQSLPKIKFQDQERYFLNGSGAGLDGYVGHLVNHSKYKKNKLNYFRHSFEAFAKFKPIAATFTADGKTWKESKVWFASVMNGAYFGGGMKIAPKANRKDQHLDLVIVKDIPKWLLILIFPTIYFGWHVIFKSYVKTYKVHQVNIAFDEPTYVQIDGDTVYPIHEIEVSEQK